MKTFALIIYVLTRFGPEVAVTSVSGFKTAESCIQAGKFAEKMATYKRPIYFQCVKVE